MKKSRFFEEQITFALRRGAPSTARHNADITTPHADARDVAASAGGSGARAGGRER